jgi:hypothetical protein
LSLNLSGYCVDDKLSRDLFKNRLTEAVELSDLLDQIIASIGPARNADGVRSFVMCGS